MKNLTIKVLLCLPFALCLFMLVSCGGYSVLPKIGVNTAPPGAYSRIIKLYNPDGMPENTLAGVVHVIGGANVCTDHPREERINSLDDLDILEKKALPYFQTYRIEDGGVTLGYVSIPVEYQVNLWRNNRPDATCRYTVQIILPQRGRGLSDYDRASPSATNW